MSTNPEDAYDASVSAPDPKSDRRKARLRTQLNEAYRKCYAEAFADRFGVSCTAKWNFVSGELYTEKADGTDLTIEEAQWSRAFSDGYAACMKQAVAQ